MLFCLNVISAVFALTAAGLWAWASVLRVLSDYSGDVSEDAKYLNFRGGQGPISRDRDGKWVDVVATLRKQGRVNALAAASAALAALFQAAVVAAPLFMPPLN